MTTFHILVTIVAFKWILRESPQEYPQIYYRKCCFSFGWKVLHFIVKHSLPSLQKHKTLVVSWRHRWFLRQSIAGFAGSQQEFSVFWIHLKLVNQGKDTQTSFFHWFLFYIYFLRQSLLKYLQLVWNALFKDQALSPECWDSMCVLSCLAATGRLLKWTVSSAPPSWLCSVTMCMGDTSTDCVNSSTDVSALLWGDRGICLLPPTMPSLYSLHHTLPTPQPLCPWPSADFLSHRFTAL